MAELQAARMFSMEGKSAVITGGGSGLGKMIARGFIANGASSICLVDMNGDRLSAVKTELEALAKDLDKTCSVTTVQADLSSPTGLQSAISTIRSTHTTSGIDSLVTAAGIRRMQPTVYSNGDSLAKLAEAMQSMAYADMEASFRVNVFQPYYMVAGLVDLLGEAAKKGEGRGSVILFSSVAAQHFGQFGPAYQLSKAAVDHMVRIMAAEFVEFYIRVNAISPGLFPSAMNPSDPTHPDYNNMRYEQDMPARRAGLEQEMAGTALYLASAAGAFTHGENVRVDGGRLFVMSGQLSKMS